MWIIYVFLALALSILLHSIIVRYYSSISRLTSFLVIGCAVCALLAIVVSAKYGLISFQLLASLLTYAFFSELYIFLFSSALTSISMNLLVKLRNKSMNTEEIEKVYDGRLMVEKRIIRLQTTGLLETTKDGGFLPTKRGLQLISFLEYLEKLFKNTINV